LGKFYISAPVDDVQLADTVRPHVTALAGSLPTHAQLRSLATEHSLDTSTMVLFEAVRAAPVHRAFIDAVDATPVQQAHPSAGAKVFILPALFHGHYPETGADAAFAADIARHCGYEVETIPIKSLGTCTENAAIIRTTLEADGAQRIWLFAVSKGSADFRAFLSLYPDSPALARLCGWINVCGIAHGTQIADYNTATAWRSLKYRLICRLFGTSYALMRELRSDHPYWAGPLALPPHMKVFNFVAVPLGAHIQTSLIGRYRAISEHGPNDGMVLCRDAILDAGPAYPVWGADHFFRSPQVIPLLYRFFAFLRTQ
jgi:hypothetical protein